MPSVYLIGFMGSGKTSIGKLLSAKLKMPFFDTDELIIKKAGKTIPQIFNDSGEAYFRGLESAVISEIALAKNGVVSVGGGAVINPDNWRQIQNSGTTVYLQWPLEVLQQRIINDKNRPLVSTAAELKKLFETRQNNYKKADVTIDCSEGMSPEQIVDQIIKLIKR